MKIHPRFYIYLSLILISFIVGLIKFKSLNKQFKIVACFLGYTFLSEVFSRILALKIHNSNPVYHFYSPIEVLFICSFYFFSTNQFYFKKIVFYTFLFLELFSVINSSFFQHLMEFNSNIDLVKTLFAILLGFIILLEKMKGPFNNDSILDSEMIILIAILWFNITSFIFFMAYNYFVKNLISTKELGIIQFTSNIIYYFLFLLSLLKFKEPVYEWSKN